LVSDNAARTQMPARSSIGSETRLAGVHTRLWPRCRKRNGSFKVLAIELPKGPRTAIGDFGFDISPLLTRALWARQDSDRHLWWKMK
jgi:hypothetical protein